jgi:hypothetical protein
VKDRRSDLFFFAQGGDGLFRRQGLSRRHRGLAGGDLDGAPGLLALAIDPHQHIARLGPAREQNSALQGTDLAGQALIFLRLPGLALEAVKGGFELVRHIIEPR